MGLVGMDNIAQVWYDIIVISIEIEIEVEDRRHMPLSFFRVINDTLLHKQSSPDCSGDVYIDVTRKPCIKGEKNGQKNKSFLQHCLCPC